MANNLSKTQIDKLGDRLREGKITESDLRMLDEYRRSFSEAYEFVIEEIRSELGLEPTGRPAKSTTSISEKLKRESIRLSQVQDIAGCRIVVPGITEQERAIEALTALFHNTSLVDRRDRPNNGYRAVHLIVSQSGKLIEIQIRTLLQHGWAELSEKAADVIDPALKYGGGDPRAMEALCKISELLHGEELMELQFAELEPEAERLLSLRDVTPEQEQKLARLRFLKDGIKQRHLAVRTELMAVFHEGLEGFQ